MAPLTTYKRRRRAFEGEDNRAKAIKRMQDAFGAQQGMERMRHKLDGSRQRQGAVGVADGLAPGMKPKASNQSANEGVARARHKTPTGMRRLSFRQAYNNRTTDTSRARVMAKYGRSAPPGPRTIDQTPRRISKPVSGSPEQQAVQMRARAQSRRKRGVFRRQ